VNAAVYIHVYEHQRFLANDRNGVGQRGEEKMERAICIIACVCVCVCLCLCICINVAKIRKTNNKA